MLAKSGRAFWLVFVIIILMTLFTYLPRNTFLYARLFLAIVFVLYLPGYSLTELVFASNKDVTRIERIAYSFGLSIAVVILLCYILNYSPLGICLEPLLVSISLFSIICIALATIRKYNRLK
jgi:uncharacterized membrane protein